MHNMRTINASIYNEALITTILIDSIFAGIRSSLRDIRLLAAVIYMSVDAHFAISQSFPRSLDTPLMR